MARILGSQRGAILQALTAAAAVVAVAIGATLFLSPKTVRGEVVDGESGRPLPGAVLKVDGLEVKAGPDGGFTLQGLRFGTTLVAEARGYRPGSSIVTLGDQVRVLLTRRTLSGLVMDAAANRPVPGARLSAGALTAASDEQGMFLLRGIDPGVEVVAAAEGYRPLVLNHDGQDFANLLLKPNLLTLRALNQYTGEPVEGAEATDGNAAGRTDRQGDVQLQYLREGAQIEVRAEGFAPAAVAFSGQESAQILLRPNTLTGAIGALQDFQISDPRKFLADLKKRGVYTIARIVVFKDDPLAAARPNLAVVNSRTGRPWVDNEGLSCASPGEALSPSRRNRPNAEVQSVFHRMIFSAKGAILGTAEDLGETLPAPKGGRDDGPARRPERGPQWTPAIAPSYRSSS